MLSVLGIPTVSKHETCIINFIEKWAINNKITYFKDEFNNLYLTKGKLNKNECYPCITAHLDSVQEAQLKYTINNTNLPLIIEKYNNKTKVYCKDFGVGGDDKCGIIIALTLMKYAKKLKIAFFIEEELGMNGSKNLYKDFFNDVGYAISFDSPESNRAAHTCAGVRLFSKNFYLNNIKHICERFNYTNFNSESYTDIINIKQYTNVQCMVFGSGYYLPHSNHEFVILEEIENAINLGISLLKELGNKKYLFEEDNNADFLNIFNNEVNFLQKEIRLLIKYIKTRDIKILDILEKKCDELNIDAFDSFSEIYDLIEGNLYE